MKISACTTFWIIHDVNRIESLLKQRENLKNAYTLLYMMPGIPSIYYGSEWGSKESKVREWMLTCHSGQSWI